MQSYVVTLRETKWIDSTQTNNQWPINGSINFPGNVTKRGRESQIWDEHREVDSLSRVETQIELESFNSADQ